MFRSKPILIALAILATAASISCNELEYGGGEGGGLGAITGSLGGLVNGMKNSLVVPTKSQEKVEGKPIHGGSSVTVKEEGYLGIKNPSELFRLLLNPIELCARIAKYFKVSFEKFFPLVTKGINFGFELVAQPVVLSFKIIEKAFVPDHCKLRFVCKLANNFSFSKNYMPTLGDRVLSESKIFKAMSDGIQGTDCEASYVCNGQPKLKEEYKESKEGYKGY